MRRPLFTLPYDVYERHFLVARELARLGQAEVLDVGGHAELLERFAPGTKVTTINVDDSAELRYDGKTLPFDARSFDAVTSIDVIEHLPAEDRLAFLAELLRVGRQLVIVCAPYGSPEHSRAEQELNEEWRRLTGETMRFLDEHVRFGLPTEAEIRGWDADLPVRAARLWFTGDFRWTVAQARRGARVQGWGRPWRGIGTRLHRLSDMALWQPIRPRERPDWWTNRFFLVLEPAAAVSATSGAGPVLQSGDAT